MPKNKSSRFRSETSFMRYEARKLIKRGESLLRLADKITAMRKAQRHVKK